MKRYFKLFIVIFVLVLVTACKKKEDLHQKVFDEITLNESVNKDFVLPSESTIVENAILSW